MRLNAGNSANIIHPVPVVSVHLSNAYSVKGPMGAFYNHSGKSDPMAGGHP
jgi:hypothetical protein